MRNTLTAAWSPPDFAAEAESSAERPHHRLIWLGAAITVVLGVIGARLAYVQCVLPDGLTAVFHETAERFEEIPARDGRILSADGVTLADREVSYELLVHYRWIEDPPDANWLRHQALRRLNRLERKDANRIAAAEADARQRQQELWRSLAEATGVSELVLSRQRTRLQERVEKIWRRVDAQRKRPSDDSAVSPASMALWNRFWQEISTPPARGADDPLVIAEQEQDHVVLQGLDEETASEIETHPERFPGTRIVQRARRLYPERDLAAHLLGSRTMLHPDELAARQAQSAQAEDWQRGDTVGRSGLERSYDAHLRGRRGLRRIVRNRQHEIVHTEVVRAPQNGQDLVLTFDTELQRRTEALLDQAIAAPTATEAKLAVDEESNRATPADLIGPRGGCVVALDVRTGAVLAAAAAPRFDLNLLVNADPAEWQALQDDPRRPLFPRVTQMALPPGSTFKALSAIAFVAEGLLDPQARFICQGYLDRPDKDRCLVFRHYGVGHNETNLADALGRSCNVYFFTAARQSGPRPLIEWAQKLGIGQPTGIDLPGEASGSLPMPDNAKKLSERRKPWYPGDTLGLVIGQSSLLVTPLQMARLMAAVANDGYLVTPHLAHSTGQIRSIAENGPARSFNRPEPKPIAGLTIATLQAVRAGLERVVQDRHGTAYKTVRLPNVKIAGKTGTAEVGGRLPDHAWFAGYVPADEPKVAFVVVIEHGGSGGKVAGPVAREFVKTLLDLGVINGSNALAKE
jgi:penicillin-binding protein 2